MADKPVLSRMKKNATKNSLNSLVTLNLSDLNKNQNGNMIIDKEADSNLIYGKKKMSIIQIRYTKSSTFMDPSVVMWLTLLIEKY